MPVAQARDAKLCPDFRKLAVRLSEPQVSLKRGKTKLSSFDSLKREAARLSEIGPVRPFCAIFQSAPNPNLSFLTCLLDLLRIV